MSCIGNHHGVFVQNDEVYLPLSPPNYSNFSNTLVQHIGVQSSASGSSKVDDLMFRI